MMNIAGVLLTLTFFVHIGIAQEVVRSDQATGDTQIIRQYRIEFDLPSDVAVYGGSDFESAEQLDTNPSGVGSRSVLYYCTNTCDEPLFWIVDGYRTNVQRHYLSGVKIGDYDASEIDFNFYMYVPFVAKGN